MKYQHTKFSLAVFLILLSVAQCSNVANAYKTSNQFKSSNMISSTYISGGFDEKKAKFFINFSKNANCAAKPLKKSCTKCLNPGNNYKFFFYFRTMRLNKYPYKVLVHYNDLERKIVITFAGPSVEVHPDYIKYIYSKGLVKVPFYNIMVEKEYSYIYFKKFRTLLYKKLNKIEKSNRKDYQYVINGYSIGGSIATLAAFDLSQKRHIKNPLVFTYGSLRIGDASFVTLVNSSVKIWRIMKSTDYITRIPVVYYSTQKKNWRFFSKTIITNYIQKKAFPLGNYVKSYTQMFRKDNKPLKKAIESQKNVGKVKNEKKIPKVALKSKNLGKLKKKQNKIVKKIAKKKISRSKR